VVVELSDFFIKKLKGDYSSMVEQRTFNPLMMVRFHLIPCHFPRQICLGFSGERKMTSEVRKTIRSLPFSVLKVEFIDEEEYNKINQKFGLKLKSPVTPYWIATGSKGEMARIWENGSSEILPEWF